MTLIEALDKIRNYHAELGYTYKYDSVESQMEHIRSLALAQFQEVAEFVDWTPWKPWRDTKDQQFNIEEAAFELVDQFFFLAALWAAIGLPTSEFEKLFELKLSENLDRIKRGYNKSR